MTELAATRPVAGAAAALGVLLLAGSVGAQGATTDEKTRGSGAPSTKEAPPYEAWTGEAFAPPSSPPLTGSSPPHVGHPARPRRPVELVPEAGVLYALCSREPSFGGSCRDVQASAQVSFIALWRVRPSLSWGLELSAEKFQPRGENAGPRGPGAVFAGAAARVYGLDTGAFDPYLQLGLGVSRLTRSFVGPDRVRYTATTTGATVRVGGGLDWFLSVRLRFGPAVAFTRLIAGEARLCHASRPEDCTVSRQGVGGLARASVGCSVRLTIMLGNPL